MGRLNISIPEDLVPLVSKWRRKINLSEICAQALRSELSAVESHRSAAPLLAKIHRPAQEPERQLARRYGLAEVRIIEGEGEDERGLRESLGAEAAAYLNRTLSGGAVLAIAGGRQSWCIVQRLEPRPLDVRVLALGYRQNDPHLLNAHANTLTTLLWLLFSPGAVAHLVGRNPEEVLNACLPMQAELKYFVVASCAPFYSGSPLANLLGEETAAVLLARGAASDFAYNFFDRRGRLIEAPVLGDQSILSADCLKALSERPDTRVILVGAGREKRRAIRLALEARLCNMLLTDAATARYLAARPARGARGRRPLRGMT